MEGRFETTWDGVFARPWCADSGSRHSHLSSDAVDLGVLAISNELSLLSVCRATLFVIQLGQVDRGATLSWISQFPGEEEVLLPPLSNLEVVGEPVEIQTMAGDPLTLGAVRVVQLRVNVNLKVKPKTSTLIPNP